MAFYVFYPPTNIVTVPGHVVVDQGTTPWIIAGTVTANQGGVWNIGTVTTITNPVAVTQSGPWSVGRTWTLDSSTDSVSAVQSGTWNIGTVSTITNPVTVNQGTSPWVITGSTTVSGTVTANQGTSPWVVSGTVAATQSGAWTTGRTWTLSSGTDSIAAVQSGTWNIGTVSTITNPVSVINSGTFAVQATLSAETTKVIGTVNQGTSPWVVSGTVAATQSGTWSVRTQDGSGNLLTSQVNGSQRALDVGINVAGVQIDPRAASPGTVTDRSGTATSVSTQVMASNANRKFFFIQNLGNAPIYFNFTSVATAGSGSIELSQFASFILEGSFISTEAINVIRSGGSNLAYTAKEG